jgi:cellulose synthase/poly-beta-1,6-N-acetylglucosamine synthase-like glycosyltransferase
MTVLVSRHHAPGRAESAPHAVRLHEVAPPRQDSPLLSEERLLCHAGVPAPTLRRLRALALSWGVSLRKAAVASGLVTAEDDARALAAMCGLIAVGPADSIALRPIVPFSELRRLLQTPVLIPLKDGRADVIANAACFTPETLASLAEMLGPAKERIAVADSASLRRAIAHAYGPAIAEDAANGLAQRRPRFSAAYGLWSWQCVFLLVAAGLLMGAAWFTPREAMAVYSAVLSFMFLLTISMRIAAASYACMHCIKGNGEPQRRPRYAELPAYTVMVAMYHEAAVLPTLVEGLKALNYPTAKLDIKLVLEEDDAETIAKARALDLPAHFEMVVVPDGPLRTKPRALNYALQFAIGDLVVIYDAEDRPEPDQLMKAAAHFRRAPRDVVCLQARLTFDNAAENWIARQFTIEYASLFSGILPMLSRARLPMPLGGTSNHFRAAALRQVGAWDAHNVTEDADLGMRLYRCGHRAEVLNSVTYEEACCRAWPWMKQRTRWLKGWIQTYGVHMRQPLRLKRELGLGGFLAFQGHFAGVIIASLVHPWSYILILHDLLTGILFGEAQTFIGRQLWLLAVFNLAAGFSASLALGFFVLQKRGGRRLIPDLIFIPAYWLMVSAACYRAVYQLVTAPHYWEKTEHGVSTVRRRSRRRSSHDGEPGQHHP